MKGKKVDKEFVSEYISSCSEKKYFVRDRNNLSRQRSN
jgi:hypothetical protein